MKTLAIICLCVMGVYADTITNYAMPHLITLTPNTSKQDITLSKTGNGEQTFFHAQAFRINGASNATYTLSANDKTTHFQSAGMLLNNSARVALMGYHTLAFSNGSSLALDPHTSLYAILSDKSTINPQASEYGAESKVRFSEHSKLLLAQNSQATFKQLRLFIHDGETIINNEAHLTIEADKAIRFQNSLQNNGGTLTLKGNVYNVGNTRGLIPNDYTTIAQFTSRNGTITVNGDFYNGGQTTHGVDSAGNSALNSFDPAFGGGGDLILYGGRMRIVGRLVSQSGGDLVGGAILKPKDSSIRLYGSVLEVQNGVQNKQDSTIIFGAYNNSLGQIIGNVTNNGTILVESKGLSLGKHTFIQGTLNNQSTIQLAQAQHDFLTITLVDSNTAINISRKENAVQTFYNQLGSDTTILHALEDIFAQAHRGDIYTYGGSTELSALVYDTKDTLATEVTTPLIALESLRSTRLAASHLAPQVLAKLNAAQAHTHLAYNTIPSKPTSMSKSYAPYQSTPFTTPSYAYAPKSRIALDMRALGGFVFGKYGLGGLAGLEAGISTQISGHNLRLGGSFIYNTLGQNLAHSGLRSTAHAFGLSLSDTIAWKSLELDIGLLGSLGIFETQSSIATGTGLDSKTNFLANHFMGELALGYRLFIKSWFIKPYDNISLCNIAQIHKKAQSKQPHKPIRII